MRARARPRAQEILRVFKKLIFFLDFNRDQVLVQKPRFIWLLEVPTQSPEDDEFNTQPLPADRRNQPFSIQYQKVKF
jgi:hypothetical protein